VLVMCGPGNNGVTAQQLPGAMALGARCQVVLLVPFSKTRGNARAILDCRRISETGHAKKGSEGRLTYVQWTEAMGVLLLWKTRWAAKTFIVRCDIPERVSRGHWRSVSRGGKAIIAPVREGIQRPARPISFRSICRGAQLG